MLLLVNASFVGGFGAARKLYSLLENLREARIDYQLVTDSKFIEKLDTFGIKADIVIPWIDGLETKYNSVEETLRNVPYDMMMSLGWRTFVPYDAVNKGKPCIILDGGWPEVLEKWPGEFCAEIYRELKSYCLTCHFMSKALNELPPQDTGIRFEWVCQPFSKEEIEWHINLKQQMKINKKLRGQIYRTYPELSELYTKFIFLNMSADYLDPWQLDYAGGWMTARQVDECRGFLTRLLVELDSQPGTILFILEDLRKRVKDVIRQLKNLRIFSRKFLPPKDHHALRCFADIVLNRAMRDVSSAQLALSGTYTLHTICPAQDGYMGELNSAVVAEELGIAKLVRHQDESLGKVIDKWFVENDKEVIAAKASTTAIKFIEQRGVHYLMELLNE